MPKTQYTVLEFTKEWVINGIDVGHTTHKATCPLRTLHIMWNIKTVAHVLKEIFLHKEHFPLNNNPSNQKFSKNRTHTLGKL